MTTVAIIFALAASVVALQIIPNLPQVACTRAAPFDSKSVRESEARNLIVWARKVHNQYERFRLGSPSLPAPLRVVSISGRTAALAIRGPIEKNNLYYAHAWQDVYAAHHGNQRVCVHIRLTWTTGTRYQDYGYMVL